MSMLTESEPIYALANEQAKNKLTGITEFVIKKSMKTKLKLVISKYIMV